MKKLLCLLLAAAVICSAAAALADAGLTGTWLYTGVEISGTVFPTEDPQVIVLTVNADGTGIMSAGGVDAALVWTLEKDTLHFGKTDLKWDGTELLLVCRTCTLHFTRR